MFVAFHSLINCEIRPKNEQAKQKSKNIAENLYKAFRAFLHIFIDLLHFFIAC